VDGGDMGQLLRKLQKDPAIQYAEPDGIARAAFVSNDPLIASGQAWHLDRIQAFGAWDFTTGASTVVAVLDTGVQATHQDLRGKILPGYDFVNQDSDASDDFGHGTAVAGVIVAAANNLSGSAGVAHGASVLPVKVADSDGFAAYSDIAQGIRYAAEDGARIINISIAGNMVSAALQEAIDDARDRGVIIVAASGNNGSAIPLYPASCAGVISVGATTDTDTLASFSNHGATLQVTAPGDGIWTTQTDPYRPYAAWRGTSFASPVVAGVAALALSLRPEMTGAQAGELLRQSTDDLGAPGWDPQFGWGRISAGRMIGEILNVVVNEEPTPPQASDLTAPSLSLVHAPANRSRTEQETVVCSGVAWDDTGIARVEALVGGSARITAGTSSWTVAVPLAPGTNTITFRAFDTAGNMSRELRRTVFRSVKATLVVEPSSGGKLVPDLNGVELEIGRAYTVRAVAHPGYILAKWGGETAGSQVLRFIMEPGLVLRPSFAPNPFLAVKGSYAGLMASDEAVAPESSGYFTATVAGSGRFTGMMLQGGRRSAFSGRFLSDGSGKARIRRAGLAEVNAALHLDFGGNSISGTFSDGAWTAQANGYRNIFSPVSNPAPQAGTRDFYLIGERGGAAVAAEGTGRISASGTALVKGRLSDGRPFARRSILDPSGNYPFFVSLSRGAEVVIGWLNFPTDPVVGASGEALWVSSGTNSFATALQVTAR
jgi:hypothetical protein